MNGHTGSARGFSLVEMLVSLVISAIVIAGAVGLMVSTQRHFLSTSEDRYLQETARVALGHLSNNLRTAGFGVDPSLAFDLGPMAGVRMDRAYLAQTFSTTSSPTGSGGACGGLCRDSTAGPDEIVFFSRDPAFGPHPLTVAATAGATSLTFAGPVNVPLQPGQILQVACYTGAMTWAYVQVSGNPTVAGGTVTVPISAGASTFPRQNGWFADACFSSVATMVGGVLNTASLTNAAEVFKVDKYHYFIRSYDSAGVEQAWGSADTRPYLMFDQGLRDGSGNTVVSPLVPDVEDLQLAYIFPADAANPIVGATAGTGLTSDDAGINLAPASGGPAYSDATGAVTRLNHHPGNIGAVRVSLVVRSAVADIRLASNNTVPAAGNRGVVAGPTGYLRLLVDTTIAVPNLSMAAPYYPTYGTFPAASGSRQLNVGGG